MNESSRLSAAQRLERYESLRRATVRHGPPVTTEEFLDTVRWSNIHMQIEVGAGLSVRVWKAWLGYEWAMILAQSSPAIRADDAPHNVAGRQLLIPSEYGLQAVSPGWVPVDALRWLGFGPRTYPARDCRLPLSALLRRVADPGTLPPCDDPEVSRIWGQPMQICVITTEPTRDCIRLLDTGRTGVWVVHTEGDTATLTPLPPRAVWQIFLILISPSTASHVPGGSEQL